MKAALSRASDWERAITETREPPTALLAFDIWLEGYFGNSMDSRQTSIVDIQLLLGHQRATTTDSYLRTLSSSISHLAEIIESSVLPQSTE